MMKHQTETPLSLKQASLGLDFPEALEHIVSRMLAKLPEDRYNNLGLVAHDLGALLRGRSVSIPKPSGKIEPSAKSKRADISISLRSLIALLATVAILAFIAGYLAVTVRTEKTPTLEASETASKDAHESVTAMPPRQDDYKLSNSKLAHLLSKREPRNRLAIKTCELTDDSFRMIGANLNIDELALRRCVFKGESLHYLHNLPLRKFDCVESVMDDAGIKQLCKFPNIQEINAGRTNLSPDNLMRLTTITSLRNLAIRDTQANDEVLQKICLLPHLTELDLLGDSHITAKGFRVLESTRLSWLGLEGTQIDDAGMASIAKIKSLRTLHLESTEVSINGVKSICKNKNLVQVGLSNCKNISAQDLQALIRAFPHVKFLSPKPDVEDSKAAVERITTLGN